MPFFASASRSRFLMARDLFRNRYPLFGIMSQLGRKLAHDAVERRLPLEADAGPVGEPQITVFDLGVVGEAAEIAEHTGIGLGAAEPEAAGDRQRHLVAAVRKQARAWPAVAVEHRHGVRISHDTVGLWRVDLDHVAARGLEPAEAHEVL